MAIVTQSRVASAPTRRQGFARFARRLTPPLTAASAPAQRAISSCLTQLLRSFNHWLRHEIPDNSLKSVTGKCFNAALVQWIRFAYDIDQLQPLAPGELSVKQVAARLGIAPDVLYCWVSQGQLAVRRAASGRLCVPFTPEIEQTLRRRIANSDRIKLRTQNVTVGDAV